MWGYWFIRLSPPYPSSATLTNNLRHGQNKSSVNIYFLGICLKYIENTYRFTLKIVCDSRIVEKVVQ